MSITRARFYSIVHNHLKQPRNILMSQNTKDILPPNTRCTLIRAPTPYTHTPESKTIFLAGSTTASVGAIKEWRVSLIQHLSPLPITILDPYRPDWDSSWVEDISFEPFRTQTQWELEMQEKASLIAFWFDPETKAPVSLLELGLALGRRGEQHAGKDVVVVCPKGYWKRGNVQVVCDRYGAQLVDGLQELSTAVESRFRELGVEG